MARQKVKASLAAALMVAAALLWSCASTPPKQTEPTKPVTEPTKPAEPAPTPVTPTPEPVTTPPTPEPTPTPSTPEPTPEPAKPAAVTDAEFQAVQDAIAEAEAAEAETYSPDLLKAARSGLADAHAKAEADPDSARTLLADALQKAHDARDAALAGRTQALVDKLDQAIGRWNALGGPNWAPETDLTLLAQAGDAKKAVVADYAGGKPQADQALAALAEATGKLADRLTAAQTLKSEVQKALDEAEAADAFVWVPDQVQTANDAFFQGNGAFKKYRLDGAEEAWNTALFEARSATELAKKALAKKQTEQLMLDTMKKIEGASGKTIVDPQDRIIAPQPWDGQQELKKLNAKPLSMVIPSDGSVVVMGDVQRVTYLDEAKARWSDGVKAMNAGDLDLANESFLQAQKLIDTYLSMAVDKVYTVRLIPDRRDSLWRISEYGDIYGTPWDWPKIWRRNQKLIQNPDLIYPGWQLIIPPQ